MGEDPSELLLCVGTRTVVHSPLGSVRPGALTCVHETPPSWTAGSNFTCILNFPNNCQILFPHQSVAIYTATAIQEQLFSPTPAGRSKVLPIFYIFIHLSQPQTIVSIMLEAHAAPSDHLWLPFPPHACGTSRQPQWGVLWDKAFC